jgi:hypothetical protein
MSVRKGLLVALAMAPVLGAVLAAPVASRAAEPVKCEITKAGKTETKDVKTTDECTKMGGKVVSEHKKK